jgi:hypothetical protein
MYEIVNLRTCLHLHGEQLERPHAPLDEAVVERLLPQTHNTVKTGKMITHYNV